MKSVILDTNFLIYCAENKVDYATDIMNIMSGGYELIVLKPVLLELTLITQKAKKYSDKQAANLALKLLEFNKVRIVDSSTNIADDAIVNFCEKNSGVIVATLDLALRKRLKEIAKVMIVNEAKELGFA